VSEDQDRPDPDAEIGSTDDDQDAEPKVSTEPTDATTDPKVIRDQGRVEILKGSKFITKDPTYQTSLFSKWEHINQKFHLLGWRHLRSWRAYVEMFSELQAFLYELVGNVDRDRREAELAFLERELAGIRQRPQRLRIPLMYNLAAHLWYNTDLGLKKPSEKSIFDLDVEKIFARHAEHLEDAESVYESLRKKREELIGP